MSPLFLEVRRAFRSLLLHRLRTLLSTLGVLFGVVAVVAMLSVGEGAKQETLEQIRQLGMKCIILKKLALSEEQQIEALSHHSQGLTIEDGQRLGAISNIQRMAPLKMIEAQITGVEGRLAPEILCATRSYGEIKGLTCDEGRFLCDRDVELRSLVCVVGADVARALGPRGHVDQSIGIGHASYKIVGVLSTKRWSEAKTKALASRNHNMCVFIPLGSESILPSGGGKALSEIILEAKRLEVLGTTEQLIRRILDRSHGGAEDYQVVVAQELLDQARRTHRTFNLVLGSIAAISLLVGGIGIMNIMLATVSERTREIGIRRAVGANERHIATQFLLETLLLTWSGALLGLLFGTIFAVVIGRLAGWKTIISPWSIILSLLMAGGVGLISGLYPALKAAAMSPLRALKSE